MKVFDQKQFKSSVEKNALPSPLIFCQYYLRTKINVLRKVCSEVKGINWKVKEGGGACEGGEGGGGACGGGGGDACHISNKPPLAKFPTRELRQCIPF